MSYRVIYKGLEVIVDSLDDLDKLADRLSPKPSTNGHAPSTASRAPQSSTIGAFVTSLSGKPKGALQAIVRKGGDMDASALCAAVGVESNLELAGHALSPIARAAKKAGIDPQDILKKVININKATKERTLAYRIPSTSLDEVRKGLNM